MATMMSNERRSFPELVGRNAQQAAAYVSAQGNFLHVNFSMIPCIFYAVLH